MIKKRMMANDRFRLSHLAKQWINELNMKRLETGYADNQPKWPYWVRPHNYDEKEWYDMNNWIIDTMGSSNWSVEHGRWVGSNRKYWFRDESDRTMFLLKWS